MTRPGALQAGEVYVDVGADVDERGFREYDRLYAKTAALPDIEKTLRVDVDDRGVAQISRAMRDADRDGASAEKSARRLSSALGDVGRSGRGGAGGMGAFNLQMGFMSGRAAGLAGVLSILSPALVAVGGAAVAAAGSLAQAAAGATALGVAAAASAAAGLPLLIGVVARLVKVGQAHQAQQAATDAVTLAGMKTTQGAAKAAGAMRDAREALTTAERNYGEAVEAARQKIKDAARDEAQARRDVTEANKDLANARDDAARRALESADKERDAARRVVEAQRSVTSARMEAIQASREAQRDARTAGLDVESAQLDLSDRGTELGEARFRLSHLDADASAKDRAEAVEAVSRAEIAYQRAVIDLARAKEAAADAQKRENDYRTQGLAQFEPYRKALEDLRQAQEDARDATAERNALDKQGIDRSPEVVAAIDKVRDAERRLTKARIDARRLARQGTQRDPGVISASEGVRDARQGLQQAGDNTASGGIDPAAVGRAQIAVDQLTGAEKNLLDQLHKTGVVFKRELGPAQDEVILGLAHGLRDTEPLMERYSGDWLDLGKTIREQIEIFGDELNGPAWKARLDPIMAGMDDVAENAGRAFRSTAEIFANIAAAATPELVDVTDDIADGLERISNSTDDQDKLGKQIHGLVEDTKAWVGLLKDTGDLLATVLGGGADEGRDLVDTLDRLVNRWDDFLETKDGQREMREFFHDAVETTKDIVRFLKGVFTGLTDVLGKIKPVAHFFAEIVDKLLGIDDGKGGIEKVGAVLGTMAALKFLGLNKVLSGLLALGKSGAVRDVLSKIPGLGKLAVGKGGVADELLSRGGSPARPLYVVDVGDALPGKGKPGLVGPDGKPISSKVGGAADDVAKTVGGAAGIKALLTEAKNVKIPIIAAIAGVYVSGKAGVGKFERIATQVNSEEMRRILGDLGTTGAPRIDPVTGKRSTGGYASKSLLESGVSQADYDRLRKFSDEIDKLARQGDRKGVRAIAGQMRDLVDSLPDNTDAGGINHVKQQLDAATDAVEDLAGTETPLERLNRKVREAKKAFDDTRDSTDGLKKGGLLYKAAVMAQEGAENQLTDALKDRRKYMIANESPMERANRKVREAKRALDDQRDATKKLEKGTDQYRDSLEKTERKQDALKQALKEQRTATRDAIEPFANLAGSVFGFGSVVAEVSRTTGANVNQVLAKLGADRITYAIKNPGEAGSVIGSGVQTIKNLLSLATGGVPNRGSGRADDHLVVAPDGRPVAAISGTEGIVNDPQMAHIDQALALTKASGLGAYGSLSELWASGMRHATGGRLRRLAGGGSVTGDLDFGATLLARLKQLSAAAHRSIYVQDGGRTIADQIQRVRDHGLYDPVTNPTGAAAPSPNAPHVLGIAADITPGREVFGSIAGRFGLGFPVPDEPWHIQLGAGIPSGSRLHGGGGGAPARPPRAKLLERIIVTAPGLLGQAAQGAADRLRRAANARITKANRTRHFDGGGLLSLNGGGPLASASKGHGGGGGGRKDPAAFSKEISKTMKKIRRPIAGLTEEIQRREGRFTALETKYSTEPEEFVILGDADTPASIDWGALKKRQRQLDELIALRDELTKLMKRQIDRIADAQTALRKAIRHLRAALKGAKGKDRKGYKQLIDGYSDALYDYGTDKITMQAARAQSRQDRQALQDEKDGLLGTAGSIINELDPEQGGPALPTGESDPDDGTPSASEIAALAQEQFDQFTQSRADLFRDYGSNFAAAGTNPFGDEAGRAAGMRFFGGGASQDSQAIADAMTTAITPLLRDPRTINVEQNYAAPPPDPRTYSKGLQYDLQAIG